MNYLDVLNNIAIELENTPYFDTINKGGCAYFAYYISNKLSSIGVKHDIIGILSRWSRKNICDVKLMKKMDLDYYSSKNVYINHFIIRLEDGNFYDCDGITNKSDIDNVYSIYGRTSSLNDNNIVDINLLKTLMIHSEWNPIFDVGNLNSIYKKIDDSFSLMDEKSNCVLVSPLKLLNYANENKEYIDYLKHFLFNEYYIIKWLEVFPQHSVYFKNKLKSWKYLAKYARLFPNSINEIYNKLNREDRFNFSIENKDIMENI